jgi:nitrite reductase (NO-forming)
MPASDTPTDPDAVAGKQAFESKCLACHSLGQGKKLGPDLAGVSKRRSKDWITRWLKDPAAMLTTDADAKAMLKEFNNLPMPNQSLSDAEIRQYQKYFEWFDAQPAGAMKPSAQAH